MDMLRGRRDVQSLTTSTSSSIHIKTRCDSLDQFTKPELRWTANGEPMRTEWTRKSTAGGVVAAYVLSCIFTCCPLTSLSRQAPPTTHGVHILCFRYRYRNCTCLGCRISDSVNSPPSLLCFVRRMANRPGGTHRTMYNTIKT